MVFMVVMASIIMVTGGDGDAVDDDGDRHEDDDEEEEDDDNDSDGDEDGGGDDGDDSDAVLPFMTRTFVMMAMADDNIAPDHQKSDSAADREQRTLTSKTGNKLEKNSTT